MVLKIFATSGDVQCKYYFRCLGECLSKTVWGKNFLPPISWKPARFSKLYWIALLSNVVFVFVQSNVCGRGLPSNITTENQKTLLTRTLHIH